MDKFLGKHHLPKLVKEQIDKMNNSKSLKEIEYVINNSSPKNTQGLGDFTTEYYQTFKEEITPVLLFRMSGKEHFWTQFMKPTYLNTKLDKDINIKGKSQANFLREHRCKNPKTTLTNWIQHI